MEFGASHDAPEQPTRFEGIRLPASHVELRDLSTVLFLLEHTSLEKTLPNLFATAALCRAIGIEIEQGGSKKGAVKGANGRAPRQLSSRR